MTKQEIFKILQQTVSDLFEIDKDKVTLESHLIDDLDLDSIDFVDLAVKIHEITGQRVKPENFKEVRTLSDLVDVAFELFNN